MPEEYYKHILDYWKYSLNNLNFDNYERLRASRYIYLWYKDINNHANTKAVFSEDTATNRFTSLICIFITMNNRLLKKIPDVKL